MVSRPYAGVIAVLAGGILVIVGKGRAKAFKMLPDPQTRAIRAPAP